ncbi:MAG: OmpH family outer membrane protein [Pirellulales bacterium]
MRTFPFALSVAVALASLAADLCAQNVPQTPVANPSANVSRYGVAVVDISYIFKNHQRFKGKMDAMKKDVQAAENRLRQERQEIAKLQEKLETFKPGTPDYKQLDEQVAKQKADFNLKATQQRKGFLEREAKIYFETNLEVSDVVKYYAQRHNIGLVVRFNGDPVDSNRREDVLRAINRPVVYQNGVDITPDILRELHSRQSVAAGTARDTGPQIPRPR